MYKTAKPRKYERSFYESLRGFNNVENKLRKKDNTRYQYNNGVNVIFAQHCELWNHDQDEHYDAI